MRTGIFGDKNVEDVVGVEVLHILFVWLLLHIFQHFYNVNFFKGKIQTCGFLPLKFFKKNNGSYAGLMPTKKVTYPQHILALSPSTFKFCKRILIDVRTVLLRMTL